MGCGRFFWSVWGLWCVANVLAVVWMGCDSLRAWLLTQSRLVAVLRSLVARRWVGLHDGPDLGLLILGGWGRVCCLARLGSAGCLLLLRVFGGVVWRTRDLHPSCSTWYLSGPRLCFLVVVWLDLSVGRGGLFGGGRAGRAANLMFVPHQLRRVRLGP